MMGKMMLQFLGKITVAGMPSPLKLEEGNTSRQIERQLHCMFSAVRAVP